MSRKDYVAIARAIKNSGNSKESIAMALCTILKQDNASFNKTRFLNACGIETEQ